MQKQQTLYGNIGFEAFDISYSSLASTTIGATDENAFAQGWDVTASGAAIALGSDTVAGGTASVVTGIGSTETGYANFVTGAYHEVTSGAYATVVGQFANSVTKRYVIKIDVVVILYLFNC
jgi:hypothetical protein